MARAGMHSLLGHTYFYGSSNANINREDLLDLITNLDPWDTPWVSQAPKVRATNVLHDWVKDYLPTVSLLGAVEGGAFSADSLVAPRRIQNQTQIFRKDVQVSETQRAVNPVGFKDAYAYEVQKATKAIARDIEWTVFSNAASAAGGTGTGRVMKSLQHPQFMISALSMGTAATYGGAAAPFKNQTLAQGSVTNTALLTEWAFNSQLEEVYSNGGNPDSVFVSPDQKRQISMFGNPKNATGVNQRIIGADTKKLVAAVDVYDTDFGLLQIVQSRWVPASIDGATGTSHTGVTNASAAYGTVFILERGMNRLAWLRPVQHTIIGKAGDSTRGIIVGEVTLEVLNEKGNGYITQVLNPSSWAQGSAVN